MLHITTKCPVLTVPGVTLLIDMYAFKIQLLELQHFVQLVLEQYFVVIHTIQKCKSGYSRLCLIKDNLQVTSVLLNHSGMY